jgi:hypothetical protein
MPPTKRGHYLGQVLAHLNHGQNEVQIHFSQKDKGRRIRWKIIQGS